MHLTLFSIFLMLLFTAVTSPRMMAQDLDYLRVHREAIVVDGHNDILNRVVAGERIDITTQRGHSDLPRFREGGIKLQVFSVWVHPDKGSEDGWPLVLRHVDSLHALAMNYPSRLRMVLSHRDVTAAIRVGALASVLSIEGTSSLQGRADRIRHLHDRGLRILAPTWNHSVSWASSSQYEARGRGLKGLSEHGRRLVRLLDTLGIILDVSHLGEQAIRDALHETRYPVIASHSSCAALRAHHRNLSDDLLREIAANGGVVMVNFYPPYLRTGLNRERLGQARSYHKRLATVAGRHGKHTAEFLREYDAILREANAKGLASMHHVADHIDHIVRTVGVHHAGIGSDFDGMPHVPVGLQDVTWLPLLTRELLRRGHDETAVEAILGGNFLRVFARVTSEEQH
jgi:membrane dipeptidase